MDPKIEGENIINEAHLQELIIRNPHLLEKNLQIIDSRIKSPDGYNLNILALDAENRVVLIQLKMRKQSLRVPGGEHIFKEALHLWNWVTDYRDEFFEGIELLASIKPVLVVPRLIIITPGFTSSLLNLASYIIKNKRIDLDLYAFDPENFKAKDKFLKPTSPGNRKLSPIHQRENLEDFLVDKLMEQRLLVIALRREIPDYKVYDPKRLEDRVNTLKDDLKTTFQKLIKEIGTLGGDGELREEFRKNQLIFRNIYGDAICEITFGPGGVYSLTCGETIPQPLRKEIKKELFTPEQKEKALKAITKTIKAINQYRKG